MLKETFYIIIMKKHEEIYVVGAGIIKEHRMTLSLATLQKQLIQQNFSEVLYVQKAYLVMLRNMEKLKSCTVCITHT